MNRLLIARAAAGVGLLLPVASALAANGDITLASSPGSAGWTLTMMALSPLPVHGTIRINMPESIPEPLLTSGR
ncbi:hypothetical protein [Enterobacter hormaechei]|uniref:hypothetical protein n=1 Tax=Enterobacter hormaechei TaxID=158836 RepID=UPI002FF42683